jgi:hypothetical protein
MVMKKRVISGCVTVTVPPFAICCWNFGITLPALPSTLPNLTVSNCVRGAICCNAWQAISARRLLAPITLVGLTALSVEISTKWLT